MTKTSHLQAENLKIKFDIIISTEIDAWNSSAVHNLFHNHTFHFVEPCNNNDRGVDFYCHRLVNGCCYCGGYCVNKANLRDLIGAAGLVILIKLDSYDLEIWWMTSTNSHIRHSCAGHTLLHWRKECGRLWVQLAELAQAPMHIVAYMYIDSYWFLPVTSSVIITCIYHSPQMIIIFKSQQYWVQPYVIIQVIRTWHQPKFHQFCLNKANLRDLKAATGL